MFDREGKFFVNTSDALYPDAIDQSRFKEIFKEGLLLDLLFSGSLPAVVSLTGTPARLTRNASCCGKICGPGTGLGGALVGDLRLVRELSSAGRNSPDWRLRGPLMVNADPGGAALQDQSRRLEGRWFAGGPGCQWGLLASGRRQEPIRSTGSQVTRTTPPRPVDVTAVVPQLAPLARPAIRLHPRPGSPTPRDSFVGGPLLWPADEPWPRCDRPHETCWMGLNGEPAARGLPRARASASSSTLARACRTWPTPFLRTGRYGQERVDI